MFTTLPRDTAPLLVPQTGYEFVATVEPTAGKRLGIPTAKLLKAITTAVQTKRLHGARNKIF